MFGLLWLVLGAFGVASISTGDSTGNQDDGTQLRHLHLLFRHGDRSPIVAFKNILPDYMTVWPEGLGQLTDTGILQQYMLGMWLRTQYPDFVPLNYNRSFYHMRSTDIDRTLMSAMANIAGFFNGSNSPLSRYGVKWSPVPVHTVSASRDILLGIAKCPKLELLWKLQLNSEESINFEKSHEKLFELLSNKSGSSINRNNLWMVADLLICMEAHRIKLPEWCTDEIWLEIKEVNRYYWVAEYAAKREVIQLEIGAFLYDFIDHIESLIKTGQSKSESLFTEHIMAYSAHDTDVTYLLAGFGVYDQKMVNYASLVALELVGPKPPAPRSEYRLKLRYKRGWEDEEAAYLQLPICANETAKNGCPWDLVVKQLQTYILDPSQYDDLCATERSSTNVSVVGYIAVGFVLCLLVMVIGSFTYKYCTRRRLAYTNFSNVSS